MKSIRRQVAWSVGAVAVFVALAGLALFYSLRFALRARFDADLVTQADALVLASEVEDGDFEIDPDVQAFAGFGSTGPGSYFEVLKADGTIVANSPSLGSVRLPDFAFPAGSAEGFSDVILPEGVEGRIHWRTFSPIEDDEGLFQNLRIVVASDLTELRSTLIPVAFMIAAFGTGGVIVILVLLKHLLRAAVGPLRELSAEVQTIDVNRLSRRLPVDELPAELHGVVDKLNELLARLEVSFVRERRFSSHAAHELRTPLAELKSMMEFGANWPDELSPAYVREMLEVVGELESIIETLTLLARTESGEPGPLERIDLAASVASCLARHLPTISERKLTVERDIEEGEFFSDPVIWHAVLNNLIGNAVAYAPEGGEVEVSASPRRFCVRNEAPNLSGEDIDHLFERFWRKEPSRDSTGHSGLGLSVVRSGAEFLGGRCAASLRDGFLRIEVDWNRPPV